MNIKPNTIIRYDENYSEVELVAYLKQTPSELIERGLPSFQEGYDDLDDLLFSILDLKSGKSVAFILHLNSPSQAIEMYVSPDNLYVAETIAEAILTLELSQQDLTWIHPDFESQIRKKIATPENLPLVNFKTLMDK